MYSAVNYYAANSATYTQVSNVAGHLLAVWLSDGQATTVQVSPDGVTASSEIVATDVPYWLPEPLDLPASVYVGAGGAGSFVHLLVGVP